MYKTLAIFLCSSVVLLKTAHVIAVEVEVAPRITDREIIERLTKLEYGQKNLEKQLDGLRSEMNAKFASVDKRFDILQWMFGLFITISIVILGFVLRMLWLMQKKQTIMESTLEKQKEELAFIRTLIEKLIPPKGIL